MKSIFLSSIPVDTGVISTTSQSGSLPIQNLQYPAPEKKWRALNNTPTVYIRLTGAGLPCDGVSVIAHNGTSEAKYRIRGGLTLDSISGVSAPFYDSGYVSMWPESGKPATNLGYANLNSVFTWSNPQALPWWSIAFDDNTNIDPFEAGRIMIDSAVHPKAALTNQIGMQVVTKGEQRRGDFNRIRTDTRGPNGRRMMLPYVAINKDTFRRDFFEFQLRHGLVKDFFFSVDPSYDIDLQVYSMQALFESLTEFARAIQFDGDGGVWRGDLIITEQL